MKFVFAVITAMVLPVATLAFASEPTKCIPVPIVLKTVSCGEGWREWQGIANIKGFVAHRERITSLSAGTSGEAWVGTSHGWLLSMAGEEWVLHAHLNGIQITGIAFDGPDTVWLSTSDGIRRLDREKEGWKN